MRTAKPQMGFSSIDEPETAVVLRDLVDSSKEAEITAAYKQVFGNAYLMESERAELAKLESQFKIGESDVRKLVIGMGKSVAYRKRFFERCSPYRFVELNCKHFLGRGPLGQAEISYHVQKLMNEGYDAEIESYVETLEYWNLFGTDCVPRFVYKGVYGRNDDFNRMNMLRVHWDGCSTSTVSGSTAPGQAQKSRLLIPPGAHCSNPYAIQKGILAGHNPQPIRPLPVLETPLNSRAPVRVRIKVVENLYKVFETDAMVVKPKRPTNDWAKVLATPKKFTGKHS